MTHSVGTKTQLYIQLARRIKANRSMGFVGFNMLMVLGCVLLAGTCNGKVYKVGDSAGWTMTGNVDYKQWSAPKTFRVGDVVVFDYNPIFHNVIQVTHKAYKACNGSSPITIYTSGNDTINITNHGHHFFICGVPGHCESGQKVDINVLRLSSPLSPSPSVAPSDAAATASSKTDTPAPSPSNAPASLKIALATAASSLLVSLLLV